MTFNLRFLGQYYDVGTNQFYNHNRFYNPELGRYMEPDPIGLEGGLNPYAYAGSNPVMNVDSSGLFLETILDIGLAGYSIKAAYDNPSWQNILAASYDTTAVVVPFLPAGAGVGG
ncbi:RHS repeat-associated core domain-containing protein [Acinetobacter baumannii]|nr:RHS repeat-associated core domain-containing protein [Acinetobacter baumannii]MCA4305205.1 RHS repeat-associated core domain-containing protein [Acinetobacter baumannii]MDC4812098.1 RHS repeat-associated core domain-containing protein [Acinetobacter baumannii]